MNGEGLRVCMGEAEGVHGRGRGCAWRGAEGVHGEGLRV